MKQLATILVRAALIAFGVGLLAMFGVHALLGGWLASAYLWAMS